MGQNGTGMNQNDTRNEWYEIAPERTGMKWNYNGLTWNVPDHADVIPDLWQSILVMQARILFSTTDLIRMNVKKETFSSG